MRYRILVALLIGCVSAAICYTYQTAFQRGAGDITWPLCGAQAVLTQHDPYSCPHVMSNGTPQPTNPLTTAFVVFPLVPFSGEVAAALFIGVSSGMLAFGLLRNYQWWRLLVFLAFPYWAALQTVQWTPLLFAVALYPSLLPLTLAKPHIGLPIALTRLTLKRIMLCAAFGIATLLVDPTWPGRWLTQATTYDGFIPLLTFPGPLLLLALFRWRDTDVRFGLLLAAMPQRLFYDQFLLWLLPRSPRALIVLTLCSWLGFLGFFYSGDHGEVWSIVTMYIPALLSVLVQHAYPATQQMIAQPSSTSS